MNFKLLSRDDFREGVFARDGHKCVFCKSPAQDAHHIIERRLFDDGGYYLENGASVCSDCHILCEETSISVERVREAAGITKICIPSHLYPDQVYDKWGNPVMPNGQRLRGELFFDESVQKILAQGLKLDLFTHHVKFPRTHHVPWSLGIHDDDRIIKSMDNFHGKRVIVTTKMDGENTSMYSDHFHARSIDSGSHPTRSWAMNFWSKIAHDIPPQWRICAENLYAEHSIHYDALPSYLMAFHIWDDRNNCLAWDDALEWFRLFDLEHVPVLYDGIYDEAKIKSLWNESQWDSCEGYVIRLAEQFNYSQYKNSVAKFVRTNHVQTNKHWMRGQKITSNGLMEK